MYPSILANFLRMAADKLDSGECSQHDIDILNSAMKSLMDEHKEEHHATIIPLKKKSK